MEYFGIGALLVVVFTVLTALFRANELFCLSCRRGRSLVVRGALPVPILAAIEEVLHLPDNALVKGFANDDEVRLTVTGLDDGEEGRLRAVFAAYPLDVAVWPRPRDRRWWQVAGFVWLAWWMQDRGEDPPQKGPPKSNIVPFRR